MSVEKERRAAGGQRIPIKTLVEIGAGQDGSAAFEAESVDVTTAGMHLRTAYLPELGEPLICRFEAGGKEVVVQGEVAWRNEEACGGDFGVRFLEVDDEALAVLRDLAGDKIADEDTEVEHSEEPAPSVQRGARVRLHIEGLASPMKARVRDASTAEVMVGSNLEFLKVGRPLDLENIDDGDKRGARIERVNIEIDPASKIPQLVVALRYLDAPEEDATEDKASSGPPTRMAAAHDGEEESEEDLARKAGKPDALWNRIKQVGPVLAAFGGKAKTVMNSAMQKAKALRSHAEQDAPRAPMRVTSPAPAGGLRSGGRKGIVRDEPAEEAPPAVNVLKKVPKKAFVIGAAALVLCITIFALARKPAAPPGSNATAPDPNANASVDTSPVPGGPMVANVPLFGATPMSTNEPAALPAASAAAATDTVTATPPPADDKLAEAAAAAQEGADDDSPEPAAASGGDTGDDTAKSKPGKGSSGGSKSFVHGKVKHPVVLSLRMSGPIKSVKGMPTATGFTVHVAGATSKDSAAGLAHKDPRIASIKVTNKGNGADLTVQFKEGVPAYAVRGAGSSLQIAIGRAGADKAEDKKTAKAGGKTTKKKAKAKK